MFAKVFRGNAVGISSERNTISRERNIIAREGNIISKEPGADLGGGGGGGGGGSWPPPCSRPPIFVLNKLFNYSKKKNVPMYLNLMFINPPPVGARCTRPSLTPPPPAKNPGSAPGNAIHVICISHDPPGAPYFNAYRQSTIYYTL